MCGSPSAASFASAFTTFLGVFVVAFSCDVALLTTGGADVEAIGRVGGASTLSIGFALAQIEESAGFWLLRRLRRRILLDAFGRRRRAFAAFTTTLSYSFASGHVEYVEVNAVEDLRTMSPDLDVFID